MATFMIWIVCQMLTDLLLSVFLVEKCKCRPTGNKESKNQPIDDKNKKNFRKLNKFRMCLAIYD
jgi:hypothetical protein